MQDWYSSQNSKFQFPQKYAETDTEMRVSYIQSAIHPTLTFSKCVTRARMFRLNSMLWNGCPL